MKDNFGKALAAVLRHEGGFVNHPADPGGMTNLGCTKATWEQWVGRKVTETEMRALTPSDVAPLYKKRYWDKVMGDDLPTGVDYAVFDAAVNSGVTRASRWLQQAVGVTDDGVIGPKTLIAVKATDPLTLVQWFNKRRAEFLKGLTTWDAFGKGWGRRVMEVNATARQMATYFG